MRTSNGVHDIHFDAVDVLNACSFQRSGIETHVHARNIHREVAGRQDRPHPPATISTRNSPT